MLKTKITLIQNELNQIRNKFPDDMKEPSIKKVHLQIFQL